MPASLKRKSFLKSTIDFFRHPYYLEKSLDIKWWHKFSGVLKSLSLQFLIVFPLAIVIGIVSEKVGFKDSSNVLFNFFLDYPIWMIFFLAVVYAPITEELIFRLILRFSYYRLGFGLSFLVYVLIAILERFFHFSFFNLISLAVSGESKYLTIGSYLSIFIFLGILFSLILKRFLNKDKAENFYRKNFLYLFYSSALAFGLIHILNYEEIKTFWYILPLFVLPQFIVGMFIAYVRIHYGLIWGIINHSMYNAFLLLPVIAVKFINFSRPDSHNIMAISLITLFFILFGIFLISLWTYLFVEYLVLRKKD